MILNARTVEMKKDREEKHRLKNKKRFTNCLDDIKYFGDYLQYDSETTAEDEDFNMCIFEMIMEWKMEYFQESELDNYLESQEADYSTHPSLLELS
jgi:hypothetical protein|tara:strand:- start:1941 stop:2228 length:288 start_codon:yes stop_codon:yes gene_type:complete